MKPMLFPNHVLEVTKILHAISRISFLLFLSPSCNPYIQANDDQFPWYTYREATRTKRIRVSMAQRRKIDDSVSDFDGNKPDVDVSFQTAANGVTKLYHQAMNFQQVAFDAGRRHSLVKAFEWVSSKTQDGKSVTSSEFMAYLQHELNTSLAISHQELSENKPCSQDQDMKDDPPHV